MTTTTPFPSPPAWALDFDGVIADSITECLLTGYNAWLSLTGAETAVTRWSEIPGSVRAEGRRLRNFIRSGEDYVFIHRAIAEGRAITTQQDFDAFTGHAAGQKETFFRAFYAERARLLKTRPEAWAALNPLYPGMAGALRRLQSGYFIVSTKQTLYIREILRSCRIPFLPERIFQAVPGRSKGDILGELNRNGGLSYIDDQVDTLLRMRPADIPLYLAGWGYNNDIQKQKAADAGIPVLTLKRFLAMLHEKGRP